MPCLKEVHSKYRNETLITIFEYFWNSPKTWKLPYFEIAVQKREWRPTLFSAFFKGLLFSKYACKVSKGLYVSLPLYWSTLNSKRVARAQYLHQKQYTLSDFLRKLTLWVVGSFHNPSGCCNTIENLLIKRLCQGFSNFLINLYWFYWKLHFDLISLVME